MKTIVKIDPEKEYNIAKMTLESLALKVGREEVSKVDDSVDNLKTVINVLIERATPKKRVRPPKKLKKKKSSDNKVQKDFKKLPSQKFPDLKIEEKVVKAEIAPKCPCCDNEMRESGLYKNSEKLEVIPKQYYIVRYKRAIYNCSKCNGSMVNAPMVPSISWSSNYGDSVIIDASLSKYCDLIPMERYCAIAKREGLSDLPPNSLITLTHSLASFLLPVYERIKEELLKSKIIFADETPHNMLEGDTTSNWYLWGFCNPKACFFEMHGTRSGDIPLNFLKESDAKHLLTDGYSGYKRALKEINKDSSEVIEVNCNAHSYRYFREASVTWKDEAEIFLELYGYIYDLERKAKNDEDKAVARQKMAPIFKQLKQQCEELKVNIMPKSSIDKAINYFLNHFDALTVCLKNIHIPLDNNFSERLLRSPVIGRKTWYGTHSKRGAKTSAVLFTLVETCKINNINPRNYFAWVVDRINTGLEVKTPSQYVTLVDSG